MLAYSEEQVDCPWCGSTAGSFCLVKGTRQIADLPHKARTDLWAKQQLARVKAAQGEAPDALADIKDVPATPFAHRRLLPDREMYRGEEWE